MLWHYSTKGCYLNDTNHFVEIKQFKLFNCFHLNALVYIAMVLKLHKITNKDLVSV